MKLVLSSFLLLYVLLFCISAFIVAYHRLWLRLFLFGSIMNCVIKVTWVPCCLVVEALYWEEPSHWVMPPFAEWPYTG